MTLTFNIGDRVKDLYFNRGMGTVVGRDLASTSYRIIFDAWLDWGKFTRYPRELERIEMTELEQRREQVKKDIKSLQKNLDDLNKQIKEKEKPKRGERWRHEATGNEVVITQINDELCRVYYKCPEYPQYVGTYHSVSSMDLPEWEKIS